MGYLRRRYCAQPSSRRIQGNVGAKRPRAELIKLLAEQRQALSASCEGYDKGNEWESARLATTVFTLLHDGGSVVSILTQLGARASLRFVSSGNKINPKNLLADTPLLFLQIRGGVGSSYKPRLGDGPPEDYSQVQFETWWSKMQIYRDAAFELTRRRLVFALRHQDGGGHVGTLTDDAYVRFKTKAIWYSVKGNDPPEPIYGAVAATMRQIAWEVTETLKQLGDDYGKAEA